MYAVTKVGLSLSLSLAEESSLDSSGILVGGLNCPRAYGMTDNTAKLFIAIATAGPKGLAKGCVPSDLRPKLDEIVLTLELQSLITWERDNRGNLAYLMLTWQGQEAINAAKNSSSNSSLSSSSVAGLRMNNSINTWSARRRKTL